MTTTGAITLVLLALGVGVALPVLIQAFVTLRTVNRAVTSLDRRVEAILADLSRVVDRLEPAAGRRSEVASLIGAAIVPAIAAAVRSLRHTDHHDEGGAGREASTTGDAPAAAAHR